MLFMFSFLFSVVPKFTDPVPSSGDGVLHDSDKVHVPLTKQRSNTTANTDHNHVDTTTASLQGRPRPLAKRTSGRNGFLSPFTDSLILILYICDSPRKKGPYGNCEKY